MLGTTDEGGLGSANELFGHFIGIEFCIGIGANVCCVFFYRSKIAHKVTSVFVFINRSFGGWQSII